MLGCLLGVSGGCEDEPAGEPYVEVREPCADRNPTRNLYWGDLHVHTAWSFDAYISEVRVDPDQAYRFATGAPVDLPPLGPDGEGTRTVALGRPLDFAAVTDHAEFLGEVALCTTPGTEAYDADICVDFRAGSPDALVPFGLALGGSDPQRFQEVCGSDPMGCLSVAADVWQRLQAINEAHYDRTAACEFTSFVAYEWSGTKTLSNLHRNVIFANEQVPQLPVSHYEAPSEYELWRELERTCLDAKGGCDLISIPHNTNWSNGNMFVPDYPLDESEKKQATRRARVEPLIEIFQHKGDSECQDGVSGILGPPDELCGFEKLRQPGFEDCGDETGSQGMVGRGCVSRVDFVRGILLEGLREQARIGVNPYKLGVMASTDTHNGTPGLVAEDGYPGHFGAREGDPETRMTGTVPDGPRNSGGGLMGVWAEQNTRTSLFEAMKRREVYGTSGPRIPLRMFAGHGLPADLCERADLVEQGYELGVPMGGDLEPGEGPLRVAVQAFADPGTAGQPGTPLQRLQIVKGWLDAAGERHVEVYDVAGGPSDAGVDPDSCAATGTAGAAELCAVWTDPDYDPHRPAYYYARAVEDPTCRWSMRDCNLLDPATRPDSCDDPRFSQPIQERAWSSPVWSSP